MSARRPAAFAWRATWRFPLAACRTPDGLADAGHPDGHLAAVEACSRSANSVEVTCDRRTISLEQVIEALGFDAAGLPFAERVRWALTRYRESIRAEDLKYIGGWDNIVREIYVTHYRRREHGRRDYRRRQWRQYEERRAQPREIPNATAESADG